MLGDWSTITLCVWGKIVTGPMRGLENRARRKNAYLGGLLDLIIFVNYLMDKIYIFCDNQQVWMLYTHEK